MAPALTFLDFDQPAFFVVEIVFGALMGGLSVRLYEAAATPRGRIPARLVWIGGGFLTYVDFWGLTATSAATPVFSLEGIGPFLLIGAAFWVFADWIDSFVSALVVTAVPGLLGGALVASLVLGVYGILFGSPSSGASIAIVLTSIGLTWGLGGYEVCRSIRRRFKVWGPWVGALSGVLVCGPAIYQLLLLRLGQRSEAGAIALTGVIAIGSFFALRYAAGDFPEPELTPEERAKDAELTRRVLDEVSGWARGIQEEETRVARTTGPPPEAEAPGFCTSCGAPVAVRGGLYCTTCGRKM